MIPAYISSPSSNGIHIGPLFLHAYGLMYVLAVAAVVLMTRYRWAKRGGDPELPYRTAIWAFPAGLIGGRIYFLITTPSKVPDHWWGPFAIWQGGLGIWGAVIGGIAFGYIGARRAGLPPRPLLDCIAPAFALGQAIGRWGNYFNQELFGRPTTLP